MTKTIIRIICILIVLLLIAVVVLNLFFHKITVISGKQFFDKVPRYARAGQEVTVTTVVVCDAELYVNGVDGRFTSPGVFVFTMPDEDVQLKGTVISFQGGA